jgi:formylglycine-generating enzyme required for sulfatase activity
MRSFALIFFVVLSALAQQSPQNPTEKRLALVIGNSDYDSIPPLPSAVKEAESMANALKEAGFDVTTVTNFRMPDFLVSGVRSFLTKLHSGDVVLIYYSGYAVQVVDDDNYLLPVNFDPKSDKEMQYRAYRMTKLQQDLEEKDLSLKIFVLEASTRLDVAVRATGLVGQGLRNPDLTESRQTLFSFAAFPGQTVPPVPAGQIGPFTEAVVQNMRQPGLRLTEVFELAKQEVGRKTSQRQIPLVNSNVIAGTFYFHAPVKRAEPPPVVAKREEFPLGLPYRSRRDSEEYVWIPAGKFKMGCVPADTKCEPHEKPQHEVTITKGFWMGRTELEVIAFQRFVENSSKKRKMPSAPLDNSRWRITNNPIVNVSWDDAQSYCEWAGGRLPTEAEWEYAARANVSDQVYPMNDENSREKANFAGKKGNDRYDYVAPVRSFDANPFGLYDMLGNVWEWVHDSYSADYYQQSPGKDPQGPDSGNEHVIRGGSFDSDPRQHLRLSFRKPYGKNANNVGFRCLLDDNPDVRKLLGR